VGDAYDNALMESVIGLFKTECIGSTVFHAGPYKTLADVEYAVAGWVDWYNHRRLHGSLGMVPPVEFEQAQRPCFSRRSSATPTASTAEQLAGAQGVAELDQADQYIPGLTMQPTWPTLRAHLLALAANTGQHPLRHLLTAASGRNLRTAGDMAAVLDWRLPALTPTNPGPLPLGR